MVFRRRRGPGVEGLEPGERVLAQASGPHGVVTATDQRLIWPGGSLGWHEIERASWDSEAAHLQVVPVPTAGHARTYRLPLDQPGRLVDVVREQVTGSVVLHRRVLLDGRHGARVVGRRRGRDGLVWNAIVDEELNPDDPDVRARLDAAIAEIRSEVE